MYTKASFCRLFASRDSLVCVAHTITIGHGAPAATARPIGTEELKAQTVPRGQQTAVETAVVCYLRIHPEVAITYGIKKCNGNTSASSMLMQMLEAQGAGADWYERLPEGATSDDMKHNDKWAAWIKKFGRRPRAGMKQLVDRPTLAPPDKAPTPASKCAMPMPTPTPVPWAICHLSLLGELGCKAVGRRRRRRAAIKTATILWILRCQLPIVSHRLQQLVPVNGWMSALQPCCFRLLEGVVHLEDCWQRACSVLVRAVMTPSRRLSLGKVTLGDLHLEDVLAAATLDPGDTGGELHLQRCRAARACHLEPRWPRRGLRALGSRRGSLHGETRWLTLQQQRRVRKHQFSQICGAYSRRKPTFAQGIFNRSWRWTCMFGWQLDNRRLRLKPLL